MNGAHDELLSLVAGWAKIHCPGPGQTRVEIDLTNGVPTKVNLNWAPSPTVRVGRAEPASSSARSPSIPEGVFEPNDLQADILEALEWKALNAEALAEAVGVSQRALYRKPGGIGELIEHGYVVADRRQGYWRTDAPPPEQERP